MENCTVEKIYWGNTDNVWKPVKLIKFNSFDNAKTFINKERESLFSEMHKYNISVNIENYGI